MNTGTHRTVATLAVTLCGFFLGGLIHGQSPPVTAVAKPVETVEAPLRAAAEKITVDTLVVSHALKTSAGLIAASRAARLNIAREHLRTASATVNALPTTGLAGAVSTPVNIRDDLTRTLGDLGVEVAVMITCEKVRTPACNSPETVSRQSQAGAAAGAAVVKLMQAAHVDQQFVTAASTIIQKDLGGAGLSRVETAGVSRVQTEGVSTLDTATLRAEATALAATAAAPPTTPSPWLRPDR